MEFTKSQWDRFRFFAGLPEMRVFWIFLPFLVALLVIDVIYLPSPLTWFATGLLVVLGVAVFFNTFSAAVASFQTIVERNELRGVMAQMGDALVAYDRNFKVLFFNPAAEKLFDLKAGAVVGTEIRPQAVESPETRLLAQVMYPSLAPALVARSKPGEYPEAADVSFENPTRELRILTSPIADEEGAPLGFMRIVRDRTRELALIKAKDEFISVASHQLRTPVTELNWALEALAGKKDMDEEARGIVKDASVSAKKLLNTVEDLLDVSKIEQGRFGYQFQSADLTEFLEKILAGVLPQAERAGIKLYFDRPKEPLPAVMIDPRKLTMVVTNLLDNALRYNIANGHVVVRARKAAQGPFVEVAVEDTGIGIPAEEITKVFTKFFRASNAVKSQTEGSGLGLYIARNIIEAHGGQMRAESEVNRSTAFYFTLPMDPRMVPPSEAVAEY